MQEVVQTRGLKGGRSARGGRWPRSLLIAVAVVLLLVVDRWAKSLALSGTKFGTGWLAFELFRNTGTVFSLPVPERLTIGASAILLTLFIAYFLREIRRDAATWPALLLIIFGAASNVADRLHHGFVVDYLIFFGRSAVNLADGMIVLGVALWLFVNAEARKRREEEKEVSGESGP